MKFITTPCPYFKNKMMKLYYEFQIKDNLPKIRADHKQVLSSVKKWRDQETWERLEGKRELVLNALQLYFKRRDANMTK